jgi:uncharacterized membrane protein
MIEIGKLLAWLGILAVIGTHHNMYMTIVGAICSIVYVFLEESDEQPR